MNMAEPVQFTPMKPQPLRGELRRDVPMSKHVSWRAGGPADRVYIPADLDDFAVFVRGLPAAEPLLEPPGVWLRLCGLRVGPGSK